MVTRVMLDLETLSTRPNAAFVQIGAVATGGSSFKADVDFNSAIKLGLHVDGETLTWWLQQSQEARDSITRQPREPISAAISKFFAWYKMTGAKEIWSNGASFDIVIMESAARAAVQEAPWKFWEHRCIRTLGATFPDVQRVKPTVAHDALEDAKAQMAWLEAILGE